MPDPGPDFRSVFEALPGPALLLTPGPDFRITACSDLYLAASKTRREDILGRNVFEAFPDNPDDPQASGVRNLHRSLQRVRETLARDVMALQQYDIRRPASEGGGFEVRYWSPVNTPVLDAQGGLAAILHQVEDVTEQVLSSQRLAAANQRLGEDAASLRLESTAKRSIENERENFRNLFRQTPEMVCILAGPEHTFEFVNEAHIRALGFDATGMPVRKAQPDSVEVYGILDEVYRTGETAQLHEIEVTVSNRRRYFNLTYAARRSEAGQVSGVMILGVEVTYQVQDREEIKQASRSLEVAVQARDEFLSVASHELKTPLTSLKLQQQFFQRVLQGSEVGAPVDRPQVEKLVAQSERQLNKLTRLVEDMLDVARIRSGKLSIERAPVILSELIRDCMARLEPIMLQAGTPVEFVCPGTVSGSFDAFRIEQVVTNLITNAMRYGERTPVRVSLIRAGDKALLTVQDHGRGIAGEALLRIFDRFERSVSSSEVSGLGLGLFITRQIVEAHDGRIWVESAGAGQGSTFFVEWPLPA